jgi:hypothetical protein
MPYTSFHFPNAKRVNLTGRPSESAAAGSVAWSPARPGTRPKSSSQDSSLYPKDDAESAQRPICIVYAQPIIK